MSKRPLKREPSTPTGLPPATPLNYAEFEREYPNLYTHLFDERYEDGTHRQTSTLLFFVERGCLKACLNDRDANKSVFLAAASVADALLALELGLDLGNLEWRQKRSN